MGIKYIRNWVRIPEADARLAARALMDVAATRAGHSQAPDLRKPSEFPEYQAGNRIYAALREAKKNRTPCL